MPIPLTNTPDALDLLPLPLVCRLTVRHWCAACETKEFGCSSRLGYRDALPSYPLPPTSSATMQRPDSVP